MKIVFNDHEKKVLKDIKELFSYNLMKIKKVFRDVKK